MKVFAKAASCYLSILYVLVQFWTKTFYWKELKRVTRQQTKCVPSFLSPSTTCFSVHLIYSSPHVHFGTECIDFEEPFLGIFLETYTVISNVLCLILLQQNML